MHTAVLSSRPAYRYVDVARWVDPVSARVPRHRHEWSSVLGANSTHGFGVWGRGVGESYGWP